MTMGYNQGKNNPMYGLKIKKEIGGKQLL